MKTLLADVGGTFVRFGIAEGGTVSGFRRYAADGTAGFLDLIEIYAGGNGLKPGPLRMATAAWPDATGTYVFAEDRDWSLNIKDAQARGWALEVTANDFMACAQGALHAPASSFKALKEGKVPEKRAAVAILGPGTGLGLAYALPLGEKDWLLQETFGGHMTATAFTDEQHGVWIALRDMKGDGSTVIFEDMASGRGLRHLYRAVCKMHGVEEQSLSSKDITQRLDSDREAADTLRLFHEFLGLFMNMTVVTLHAFGGLYIHGGLIDGLMRQGVFDFPTVEKFMCRKHVPVVSEAIEKTPVNYVDDPFIALHGLASMKA